MNPLIAEMQGLLAVDMHPETRVLLEAALTAQKTGTVPDLAEVEAYKRAYHVQACLIYSMIVAGKSANFADRAMKNFIVEAATASGTIGKTILLFDQLALLSAAQLVNCLHLARTGNYGKLSQGIFDILEWHAEGTLNLETVTPGELEECHGIGPKTSRFFIIWIRPAEQYAALDVHVLRWLRACGHDAPKATPQCPKKYAVLEKAFIAEATKLGKTARELDSEIWEAGAGRTQKTPLP